MDYYQSLGRASDEGNGHRYRTGALAGEGVSSQLQAVDGGRKVPVPQCQFPAQTPDMMLPGMGIAPPTCPLNRLNDLSGALTAMGALLAAITPNTTYPSTCVVVCVSPISITPITEYGPWV